jgi:hypothetical protein
MKQSKGNLPSTTDNVSSFLKKARDVKSMTVHGRKPGRLAFIIDATASRQPTWERACQIQYQMFRAAEQVGSLAIQLIYYRGFNELYISTWKSDSQSLLKEMCAVNCLAGETQIHSSLEYLLRETILQTITAAVFIGDACEEPTAGIYDVAGRLGVNKTPVFMFQENNIPGVGEIFKNIARLSGGAYCRFDSSSADLLAELLSGVAVYAAGGQKALESYVKNKSQQLQAMSRQLLR